MMVCKDCAAMIANGEIINPDISPEQEIRIKAIPSNVHLTFEGGEEFSWRPCDTCGCLPGMRLQGEED